MKLLIRIIGCLLVLCVGVLEIQAQILVDGKLDYSDSTKFAIRLSGNRSDLSNAITREFLSPFIFGGGLEQPVIDNVESNLDDDNDYFSETQAELDLVFYPDSGRWGFGLNYAAVQTGNIGFSSDLFRLLFEGNSAFGENPAILNESQARWQIYQRVSGKLHHRASGSYIGLGVYFGNNFADYDLGNIASLTNNFENIAGGQIITDLTYSTSGGNSQTSNSGIGIGLSGSLNFRGILGLLNFSFDDLGVMNWKDVAQSDTSGTISFSGYTYDYGSDASFNNIFDNLVDSLLPVETIGDKTKSLPTKLALSYYSLRLGSFSISLNLQHRFGIYPRPQAYGALNFHLARQILWIGVASSGNPWPGVNVGGQFALGNAVHLVIGSQYLQGALSKEASQLNLNCKVIARL